MNIKWCVGFEHVALMDYEELEAALSSFFKTVKYLGFNQSVAPNVDERLSDQQIEKWVAAAKYDPANATSLIAVVRKDKALALPPQRTTIVDWTEADSRNDVTPVTLSGSACEA